MTESKTEKPAPKSSVPPETDEPEWLINLTINVVAQENTSDDEEDLRRQSNPVEMNDQAVRNLEMKNK